MKQDRTFFLQLHRRRRRCVVHKLLAETRQDFITLQPFIKPEPNIEAEKMNSPVVVVAAAVNVVKLFLQEI